MGRPPLRRFVKATERALIVRRNHFRQLQMGRSTGSQTTVVLESSQTQEWDLEETARVEVQDLLIPTAPRVKRAGLGNASLHWNFFSWKIQLTVGEGSYSFFSLK